VCPLFKPMVVGRVPPLEFFAVSGVLGDFLDFIGARRHAKLWRGTGREVVGMPNVLIHKASELKAETRVVLEAELGRPLQDDEEVSIMAFAPHPAPAGKIAGRPRTSCKTTSNELTKN